MRLLVVLLPALISLPLCAQPTAAGGVPGSRIEIPTTQPRALRTTLEDLGYDVSCQGLGDGFVRAVVSTAELRALDAAGFAPHVVAVARPLRSRGSTRSGGGGGSAVPSGYRDFAAIQAELAAIAASHPTLATVVDIAATYGPGATAEGRPIPAIRISDNVLMDEDEPAALFVSGHHCREIVTPEIGLEFTALLLGGYGVDPAITAAVDEHEIWIIPTLNPDGLEYVWSVNNLWRKNRKPLPSGDVGIDLNRNYPFGWGAPCGGSTNPSSATYRGPGPSSEEEVQSLIGLSRAQRFSKVIDFHSFAEEVRRGYPCANLPAAIDQVSLDEAAALAAAATYQVAPSCCLGGHIHQQMAEHTAYTFLVETHTEFQPTHAAAMTEIQSRILPMCLSALGRAVPLTGVVTDAGTGAPLTVDVSVAGVGWQTHEARRTDARFGRYRLWLPDGTWDVTFSRPGYVPLTQSVTLAAGTTATLNGTLAAGNTFDLDAFTTGWGTGDLRIGLHNVPAGASEGYTLFSQATTLPPGAGVVLGLWPDSLTMLSLTRPASPGDVFHWTAPPVSGLFPSAPISMPAGTYATLVGSELDVRGLALGPGVAILGITPLMRLQF